MDLLNSLRSWKRNRDLFTSDTPPHSVIIRSLTAFHAN
jgi:hypothetical protein